jgi:hypothetical protein
VTSAIRSGTPTPTRTPDASGTEPADGASPCPELDLLSADSLNDAMSMLYASIARLRDADAQGGRLRVDEYARLREKALAAEKAALDREQANQSDAGEGFFSGVGRLLSDTIDDVVHARFADAADDVGDDVAEAWNSPKFWSDLETGFKDIALLADGVAQAAAEIGGVAGAAIAAAATGLSTVATASAALAHARGEHFVAEAQDARADATSAQNGIDKLSRSLRWLMGGLAAANKAHQQALQSAQIAMHSVDETLLVTVSVSVRG